MLNPQSASKSPLSSRVALPIALMLAGIFGLGISLVQPTMFQSPQVSDLGPLTEGLANPTGNSGLVEDVETLSDDVLATKADEKAPPAPADLVNFCTRHVTERRSFVVFKRGTCVVISEPCEDPLRSAKEILARCKDVGAKFMTEPTQDGDMIVAFKDPVFHRFSASELQQMEPWLKHATAALPLLTPDEAVSAGDGWTPPENARIGLLARRRMLEDAANAVPVKVIRARDRAMVSR
jgi:hypothetical protein